MLKRTLYHFHFCCGLGGGAKGFNRSRPRIGNAVPPHAAEAIADVMGTTLLLAEQGETFRLSNTPIWVRNVAVALSVSQPAERR
ncbi:hypothetical protein ACM75Y_23220 [Pseudomonas aeruginosa]|uniref:hypothetical protein n=1 Tax=Pseudomonas aeruginosa TaxID=287 RepID=UPI0028DDE828|nr:hypothetical protein [Pseudomonas aeruginosa]ELK4748674.1 hypothetical protein [Pseudomonas aeruginosa]HBP1613632.1 hypothetical protein [Pseudomonas aeruginosa]